MSSSAIAPRVAPLDADAASPAARSHPRAGRWRLFVGPFTAIVAFLTLWLSWLDTGSVHRSAFQVLSALRQAGLMSRPASKALFVGLAVLPGLVGAAWLLAPTGYRRLAAAAGAGAGLLTLTTAVVVRHVAGQEAGTGTGVALVAGSLALAVNAAISGGRPPWRWSRSARPPDLERSHR